MTLEQDIQTTSASHEKEIAELRALVAEVKVLPVSSAHGKATYEVGD